jgi:transposase
MPVEATEESVENKNASNTDKSKKKMELTNEQYEQIKLQFACLADLEKVRVDFFKIFSTIDVLRLDTFIEVYQTSQYQNIATFARGLKKDYDAVALAVTSPLSNGPSEGFNNKVKTFSRQTFGRAGNDLLNAKMILSNIDPNKKKKPSKLSKRSLIPPRIAI